MLPDLSALLLDPASTGAHHDQPAQRARAEQAEPQHAPGGMGDDLLALVLSMIAFEDPRKYRACEEARAVCTASTAFRRVCATHPTVWAAWSKAIFASRDASEVAARRGEGLIYDTFYDETDPESSFKAMCEASAVAEITGKLFVLACYNRYLNQLDSSVEFLKVLLDPVNHTDDDNTKKGKRQLKRYATELENELWSIRTHEPGRDSVEQLLANSKLRPVFNARKNGSPIFRSLLDGIFTQACLFVFRNYGLSVTTTPSGHVQHIFDVQKVIDVSHVLGTYVVCLEQLEKEYRMQGVLAPGEELFMTKYEFAAEVERLVVERLGSARAAPIQSKLAKLKDILTRDLDHVDDDEEIPYMQPPSVQALTIYIQALRMGLVVAMFDVFSPGAALPRWVRDHGSKTEFWKTLMTYTHKDDVDLSVWDKLLNAGVEQESKAQTDASDDE